jgi:hypothetical protein
MPALPCGRRCPSTSTVRSSSTSRSPPPPNPCCAALCMLCTAPLFRPAAGHSGCMRPGGSCRGRLGGHSHAAALTCCPPRQLRLNGAQTVDFPTLVQRLCGSSALKSLCIDGVNGGTPFLPCRSCCACCLRSQLLWASALGQHAAGDERHIVCGEKLAG